MFERFTRDARDVVVGAVGHAERAGDSLIDDTHMVLALLDREGGRAAFALSSLGARARRDAVAASLVAARRRGGFSQAETDALAELGIDLERIVSRVEEAHGTGALDASARGGRPRRGRPPFGKDAKQTLQKALRMASGRRDRHIGDEHLLLALLARPTVVAEVLADHGVTYAAVERCLAGSGDGEPGAGTAKAG